MANLHHDFDTVFETLYPDLTVEEVALVEPRARRVARGAAVAALAIMSLFASAVMLLFLQLGDWIIAGPAGVMFYATAWFSAKLAGIKPL